MYPLSESNLLGGLKVFAARIEQDTNAPPKPGARATFTRRIPTRRGAVDPQRLSEALLDKLKLGHIVHFRLRAAFPRIGPDSQGETLGSGMIHLYLWWGMIRCSFCCYWELCVLQVGNDPCFTRFWVGNETNSGGTGPNTHDGPVELQVNHSGVCRVGKLPLFEKNKHNGRHVLM